MPYGIPDGLFYGGLVFSGGFFAGYWMESQISTYLNNNAWAVGFLTGAAAVGVYVALNKEVLTGLPSAF